MESSRSKRVKSAVELALDNRQPKRALDLLRRDLKSSANTMLVVVIIELGLSEISDGGKLQKRHSNQAEMPVELNPRTNPGSSCSVCQFNKPMAHMKTLWRQLRKLRRFYPNHRLFDDASYRLVKILLKKPSGLAEARRIVESLIKRDLVGDRVDDAIFGHTFVP